MLERLECQIIKRHSLENLLTIGAEYYSREFVTTQNKVLKVNHKSLKEISDVITDGDHGSPIYEDKGILYLLSESINEGYIDISKCRYISHKKHSELKRSCLKPGDVVVTKTGVYFGKSAVIPDTIEEANTIAHVGKISLKEGYNPYLISTFLNCKYGYYQLRRRGIKATRPEIKLVEFDDIVVPIFSPDFGNKIKTIILNSQRYIHEAQEAYTTAENCLNHELKLDKWKPTKAQISERTLADIIESGRIDAEYYQPKYDELIEIIKTHNAKKLEGEVADIAKSIEPGSDEYKDKGIPFYRISNFSKAGLSQPDIYLDETKYNTCLMPKKDTVLLSKDGSVCIAYKLDNDLYGITSSALLHLTVTNSEVLPDYLALVLNSPIVKMQAEQATGGSIIQHWRIEDIRNVLIPIIDKKVQEHIAGKVQESFRLRNESVQLLSFAKRAVEIAIEKDEESAIEYLNHRN